MAGDNRDQNKPATKITLSNVLWPLALSAYAIFRLTRPGHMSIPSTVWYYILAIFGALFAVLALLGRSMPSPKQAGKQIDDLNRGIYAEVTHRRRRVDEQTIAEYSLDQSFYRRNTVALEALRFTKVADYVDSHLEQTVHWSRAVLRGFLSADGTVMGAIYDVRIRGWIRLLQWIRALPLDLRSTEFETELSDGSFVTTSDQPQAGKTLEFPGISRRFLPRGTTPADLFASHRDHIREVISARPDVTPLVLRSFDDLCAAQDRQDRLKSRHRNSADFDPVANIARIAGKPLTAAEQEMAQHAADAHAQRIGEAANQEK